MKKDIIRLARNLILLSVPLIILIVYTWAVPMNYMSAEYVLWAEEHDYVNHADRREAPVSENMTGSTAGTIIIGDSRAKSSVIPSDLNDSVYNIGIGGTTPVEMYYAAANYIDTYGAPKNAIIIFAPYHLCDIDNWNQTLYYNYLSVPELADVYKNAVILDDPVINTKGWFTNALSYRLRLPGKYLAAEYDAHFTGNRAANEAKFKEVRNDRGWCEFGSDDGNSGTDYETHHEVFDSSPLVLLYYDKLLTLLNDSGVNVIVEQAPINQASADAMHAEFMNGYTSYLEAQEIKYPAVSFVKDVPVYNNKYFGDNNHLNKAGAAVYTSGLKQYLESIDFPW